jgi:hypothetical protein
MLGRVPCYNCPPRGGQEEVSAGSAGVLAKKKGPCGPPTAFAVHLRLAGLIVSIDNVGNRVNILHGRHPVVGQS